MSPTDDGYPTEEELGIIKEWDNKHSLNNLDLVNCLELVEFIRSIWWTPEWGFRLSKSKDSLFHKEKVWKLELSTGGWSGNEEIIYELQKTYFWMFYWKKSIRGGHFFLEFPIKQGVNK